MSENQEARTPISDDLKRLRTDVRRLAAAVRELIVETIKLGLLVFCVVAPILLMVWR